MRRPGTASRDRLGLDFHCGSPNPCLFHPLDLPPLGRQEEWEDSPKGWPQTPPYVWWRKHDECDDTGSVAVEEVAVIDSAAEDSRIRLWIYHHFSDTGRAPSPVEIAAQFGITPDKAERALNRLQQNADALVLIPGSPYIWMAEPFSAVPTCFAVRSGDRQWWGNCIWDALGILSLLGVDGEVLTACPHSGWPLRVAVAGGALLDAPGVVHFAVQARDWWRDIGFT